MAEPELLPCPFGCGDSATPKIAVTGGGQFAAVFWVEHRCRAEGPHQHSRAAAIAAWNHRARPSLDVQAVAERIIDRYRIGDVGDEPNTDLVDLARIIADELTRALADRTEGDRHD